MCQTHRSMQNTIATYSHIHPVPQLPGFAARIEGVDLAKPLCAAVRAELHQALLDFGMLVFAPQPMQPEQHIAQASAFGDIATGAFFPRLEGHPQVKVIRSDHDHPPALDVWHSDATWKSDSPTGTMIELKEVPPVGGNTAWAWRQINGVADGQSRSILAFLREWVAQPEFVYAHKWEPDDIAVWDNRSPQHYATADYWPAPRELRRVTFRARYSNT